MSLDLINGRVASPSSLHGYIPVGLSPKNAFHLKTKSRVPAFLKLSVSSKYVPVSIYSEF